MMKSLLKQYIIETLQSTPTEEILDIALAGVRPTLIQGFDARAKKIFELMIEKWGNPPKGIYNSYDAPSWRELPLSTDSTDYKHVTYFLDDAKVLSWAERLTDASIASVKVKLMKKLQGAEELKIHSMNSSYFTITGNKSGHRFVLEQYQIVNVSSKGKLFNQWPAVFYIDGKKASEAAFSKL